jgi:hypothetical protein
MRVPRARTGLLRMPQCSGHVRRTRSTRRKTTPPAQARAKTAPAARPITTYQAASPRPVSSPRTSSWRNSQVQARLAGTTAASSDVQHGRRTPRPTNATNITASSTTPDSVAPFAQAVYESPLRRSESRSCLEGAAAGSARASSFQLMLYVRESGHHPVQRYPVGGVQSHRKRTVFGANSRHLCPAVHHIRNWMVLVYLKRNSDVEALGFHLLHATRRCSYRLRRAVGAVGAALSLRAISESGRPRACPTARCRCPLRRVCFPEGDPGGASRRPGRRADLWRGTRAAAADEICRLVAS